MSKHAPHVIRLQLNNIQQLFNSLDPSPFLGRDLDTNAEAFIMGWAQEYPAKGDFCLEITLATAISAEEKTAWNKPSITISTRGPDFAGTSCDN